MAQWTYTTMLFLLDLLVLPEICSFLLHIPPAHRKEITCFQAGVLWPARKQRAERRWRKWEEEREGKGGVKNETWLSGPFTHSSSPASALCSPLWTDWTFKYVHIMCLWLNRHISFSPKANILHFVIYLNSKGVLIVFQPSVLSKKTHALLV